MSLYVSRAHVYGVGGERGEGGGGGERRLDSGGHRSVRVLLGCRDRRSRRHGGQSESFPLIFKEADKSESYRKREDVPEAKRSVPRRAARLVIHLGTSPFSVGALEFMPIYLLPCSACPPAGSVVGVEVEVDAGATSTPCANVMEKMGFFLPVFQSEMVLLGQWGAWEMRALRRREGGGGGWKRRVEKGRPGWSRGAESDVE